VNASDPDGALASAFVTGAAAGAGAGEAVFGAGGGMLTAVWVAGLVTGGGVPCSELVSTQFMPPGDRSNPPRLTRDHVTVLSTLVNLVHFLFGG
jgi:hypothetical protein